MPAPKSTIEPLMTWADSRGYTLSDRLWNVSESTMTGIDLLLDEALSSGMSSVALAKRLEQYLLPGRSLPQTNKPYGSSGSYNARRLARTEITLAHSRATQAAAIANPFVDRMYYHLSASHVSEGGSDLCEIWADESDANNGFEPSECPLPGESHPNCMCYTTSGVMPQEDAVAAIRAGLEPDEEAAFTDDNSVDLFTLALWGSEAWAVFDALFG